MKIEGRCHRFGDNVSTDDIIAEKYKSRLMDVEALLPHLMENLDGNFAKRLKKGDFIVAGKNFGTGSSREIAPLVIRSAGCGAVLAKSFARIFYRNSFNIGLRILECDTTDIAYGDYLIVDPISGDIQNRSQNKILHYKPFPRQMKEILQEGGLIAYFKKYGKFPKVSNT